MATSPEEQLNTMLANIPDKTGKTLVEWINIILKSEHEKHGQIVKFLKGEYGVTHGFASLIAAKSRETGEPVNLVDEQYSKGKEALRPLYESIINYVQSLGKEVEITPKKSSVSLRSKKQFALITPATKSRIDLGLALKGKAVTDRLETYNAMCSHRVRLEKEEDFNDQVKAWLQEAYSRAS